MPPAIVYGSRARAARAEDQPNAGADDTTGSSSSPSFRMGSSPALPPGKHAAPAAFGADTSYDTSVASAPGDTDILDAGKGDARASPQSAELQTDVESEEDSDAAAHSAAATPPRTHSRLASKMRGRAPLPLEQSPHRRGGRESGSDGAQSASSTPERPQAAARQSRMERLRALARQRTERVDELQAEEPETRSPAYSPSARSASARSPARSPSIRSMRSPSAARSPSRASRSPAGGRGGAQRPSAALLSDSESDSSVDLEAVGQAPAASRLSKKEEREMHRVSAQYRREQRTALPRAEPKRYHLSELLSTIEHSGDAEKEPRRLMNSSDPIETSTPSHGTASSPPRAAPSAAERKRSVLRSTPAPLPDDSDSDLEIVSSPGGRAPWTRPGRLRLGTSPPPRVVRTPRKTRAPAADYRSPNTPARDSEAVPAAEMDAAAHTFAPASERAAGHVAFSSPARGGDASSPTRREPASSPTSKPRRFAPPVVMDQAQLNATLLRKSYEQNAAIAARKEAVHRRREPREAKHDSAERQSPDGAEERGSDAESEADQSAELGSDRGLDRDIADRDDAEDGSDDEFARSLGSPRPLASLGGTPPAPASPLSATSPASQQGSEKENVPLPSATPSHTLDMPLRGEASRSRTLQELPTDSPRGHPEVDLGQFFGPTQSDTSETTGPRSASVLGPTQPSDRSESNSSVLAQFFESTQEQTPRGASFDLFANRRRAGPVGGTTQLLDAPADSAPFTRTRSQEAMPPPRTQSRDAFAALRKAQQQEADQLLPSLLPSVDPSLAERGEEALREAQQPVDDGMLYINQEGFFTQTKPAASQLRQDSAWMSQAPRPDGDQAAEGDEPANEPAANFDGPLGVPEESPAASEDEAGESDRGVPEGVDLPDAADAPFDGEEAGDDDGEDAAEDAAEDGAPARTWSDILDGRPEKQERPRQRKSAFVYGEAEESDEEDAERGEHGGLAGIFSDRESQASDASDSEDDADLESLLDDERDVDEEEKDELARRRYQQDREQDDAAIQALHERAAHGVLRNRRRGRDDDGLADLLDDDADEEELRRRLQAPRFAKSKRRHVEGDGMDDLAAREDSVAFVRQYTETHTNDEDATKYTFLAEPADSSDADSDTERPQRISGYQLRSELLTYSRRQREEPQSQPEPARRVVDAASSDDDDSGARIEQRLRRRSEQVVAPRAASPTSDEDASTRILFHAHKVDPASMTDEQRARRERLLEEFGNEPLWRDARGGRGGIDRRRSSQRRTSYAQDSSAPAPAPAAPSRLVGSILRRDAHFGS